MARLGWPETPRVLPRNVASFRMILVAWEGPKSALKLPFEYIAAAPLDWTISTKRSLRELDEEATVK